MGPDYFEERQEGYRDVLQAMYDRPDEIISTATVDDAVRSTEYDVDELVQDLVLLGEVELCHVTGIAGRVWLKRRQTPEGPRAAMTTADSVWQGYKARDYRDKIADRLYLTRQAALQHLSESLHLDPETFEPLSFLDDVWVAPTSGAEGYEEMTAVVRREPVYQTSDGASR